MNSYTTICINYLAKDLDGPHANCTSRSTLQLLLRQFTRHGTVPEETMIDI